MNSSFSHSTALLSRDASRMMLPSPLERPEHPQRIIHKRKRGHSDSTLFWEPFVGSTIHQRSKMEMEMQIFKRDYLWTTQLTPQNANQACDFIHMFQGKNTFYEVSQKVLIPLPSFQVTLECGGLRITTFRGESFFPIRNTLMWYQPRALFLGTRDALSATGSMFTLRDARPFRGRTWTLFVV